jgi:hypothetical protein
VLTIAKRTLLSSKPIYIGREIKLFRNGFKIFVRKFEENIPLRKSKRRWEGNIITEMDYQNK